MTEGGRVEKALNVVKTLNLTNVLIIALMLLLAIPTYFSYRFMADASFRHEFMSSAVIVEQHAPCVVLEATKYGAQTRHSVFIVYAVADDRMERLIGLRAPGVMTEQQITETCKLVLKMAADLKQ